MGLWPGIVTWECDLGMWHGNVAWDCDLRMWPGNVAWECGLRMWPGKEASSNLTPACIVIKAKLTHLEMIRPNQAVYRCRYIQADILTTCCFFLHEKAVPIFQSPQHSWYEWLKCVLLGGWLCVTSGLPFFLGDVIHICFVTLQVLQQLPVTIAALKQGNMGKLIKQLSKQEHPG